MCGICGIISREPLSDPSPVAAMCQAMIHRGPDGQGWFQDRHLALAMRRLSIIDLAGGWQPLYNEDRSLALMINGEIYNYLELRADLQAQGHVFATGSDCETVLHLYEEHGLGCLEHLRGMFALALWDQNRGRLLLARDRMGEKPLYLQQDGQRLVFASEMKALLGSGLVKFDLDPGAVNAFFHHQFVPEPDTPLRGVRKLPAGHFITVSTQPWRVEQRRWWSMEDAPVRDERPDQAIRAQLEEVSRLIVRSDVPVGVALSGGMDSSAIAVLAARAYPGQMHAFTVGYQGRPNCDERAQARELARHLGMPFHEVEVTTEEVAGFFPDLVFWRDDPIADIAGHSYHAVMRLAREHGVPVMLMGHGGDELFWGYWDTNLGLRQTRVKDALLRGDPRALARYLKPTRPPLRSPAGMKQWLRQAGGLPEGWQRLWRDLTSPRDRVVFCEVTPDTADAQSHLGQLYTPEFQVRLAGGDPLGFTRLPRPWRDLEVSFTRLISEFYLMENGIAQGDRLSMANAVELRLPLVDHHLVETVIGLRKSRSDAHLPPKTWLREALGGIMPQWVLDKPKHGFAPPLKDWFREIFARHGRLLRNGYLVQNGVLRPEAGERLASGQPGPPRVTHPLSFKALVLEVWCRRMEAVVQAAASGPPPASLEAAATGDGKAAA